MWFAEMSGGDNKNDTRRDSGRQLCRFVVTLSLDISDQTPEPADISTEIRLNCFDKKHSPCLKLLSD